MNISIKISMISVAFITGCAASVQDQHQFDDLKFKTTNDAYQSVNTLKQSYFNETGSQLSTPPTASCDWDSSCYYNSWASVYDQSINSYRAKKQQEADKSRKEEEEKCDASIECKKQKDISEASYELNSTYNFMLANNPYLQGQYDGVIRLMCRKSGEAQRNGISLEQMNKNIDMAEGISPEDRHYIKIVARSCWTLSKWGIENGNELIKTE